ncbi:hypothetical protein CHH69_17430 [Terribacillus saccharophilus]|uniref:hypothetical protein n=1 Tax=Terribacillus saccharophilus TaxID=361277 RepID=UPI000BA6792D|nr:hypothetical protein [Terribacillus saccharophilus]PAF34132.1 hypothetical protein CHH69_17430 [Terribacillus saccharophilus]
MSISEETKEKILVLLTDAQQENMYNFNTYSLLINANDITSEYYRDAEEDLLIDPAGNVPEQYRFSVEMVSDEFRQPRLVELYSNKFKNVNVEDYFIRTISYLDILLEEMYRLVLLEQGLSERNISRKIKFGNGHLPHVLIQEIDGYRNDDSQDQNVVDYMFMYEIYRQYRHAIVHSHGVLNSRHLTKIDSTCAQIESRLGTQFRRENLAFIESNKVELNIESMAMLRHWVQTFIWSLRLKLS